MNQKYTFKEKYATRGTPEDCILDREKKKKRVGTRGWGKKCASQRVGSNITPGGSIKNIIKLGGPL